MTNGSSTIIQYTEQSLTKRETFAAMAMQGTLAGLYSVNDLSGWSSIDIAKHSVELADELIKALNEPV